MQWRIYYDMPFHPAGRNIWNGNNWAAFVPTPPKTGDIQMHADFPVSPLDRLQKIDA
jgi:hypothetical protein